jgi:hypothetical protein
MVELVIAATPVQPSADALREELASLRPSALERRARSLGVSEADLDEAKDSDTMSAKEAMIELVVAATPIAPSHDVRLAALHKNLAELKPSAIEKRAREAGVTEQQLDEAKDSDEPRSTFNEVPSPAAQPKCKSALENDDEGAGFENTVANPLENLSSTNGADGAPPDTIISQLRFAIAHIAQASRYGSQPLPPNDEPNDELVRRSKTNWFVELLQRTSATDEATIVNALVNEMFCKCCFSSTLQ